MLALGQIVRVWRAYRGRPRVVADLRWPGQVYSGFARGRNTCLDHAEGSQTWAEFVRT